MTDVSQAPSGALTSNNAKQWVAVFAFAVLVTHHISTLAKPLGSVSSTRWADWFDLVTPILVIGAGAMALARGGANTRTWTIFCVGAFVYCEGHGIHLAGNSVGNIAPGPTEHLWDEVIGHSVWYAGMWVMVIALAQRFVATSARLHPGAVLATVGFGFNTFTNGVEGGSVPLMSAGALTLCLWGWRHRHGTGAYMVGAGALALVGFAGWGLYWGGWPQFSELGWI